MTSTIATPAKIRSILKSFVHSTDTEIRKDNDNSTVEVINESDTITDYPPRKSLDNKAYKERLETFQSLSWFAKPLKLSPLECARFGWANVDVDILQCVSCKAYVSGHLPPASDIKIYAECIERLKERLTGSHHLCCSWSTDPCPEYFMHVGCTDEEDVMQSFLMRIQALCSLDTILPIIHEDIKADMDISNESIESLVSQLAACASANDLEQMPSSPSVIQAAVILAIAGWTRKKESTCAVARCEYCQREAGLWNYHSCSNDKDNHEEQIDDEDDVTNQSDDELIDHDENINDDDNEKDKIDENQEVNKSQDNENINKDEVEPTKLDEDENNKSEPLSAQNQIETNQETNKETTDENDHLAACNNQTVTNEEINIEDKNINQDVSINKSDNESNTNQVSSPEASCTSENSTTNGVKKNDNDSNNSSVKEHENQKDCTSSNKKSSINIFASKDTNSDADAGQDDDDNLDLAQKSSSDDDDLDLTQKSTSEMGSRSDSVRSKFPSESMAYRTRSDSEDSYNSDEEPSQKVHNNESEHNNELETNLSPVKNIRPRFPVDDKYTNPSFTICSPPKRRCVYNQDSSSEEEEVYSEEDSYKESDDKKDTSEIESGDKKDTSEIESGDKKDTSEVSKPMAWRDRSGSANVEKQSLPSQVVSTSVSPKSNNADNVASTDTYRESADAADVESEEELVLQYSVDGPPDGRPSQQDEAVFVIDSSDEEEEKEGGNNRGAEDIEEDSEEEYSEEDDYESPEEEKEGEDYESPEEQNEAEDYESPEEQNADEEEYNSEENDENIIEGNVPQQFDNQIEVQDNSICSEGEELGNSYEEDISCDENEDEIEIADSDEEVEKEEEENETELYNEVQENIEGDEASETYDGEEQVISEDEEDDLADEEANDDEIEEMPGSESDLSVGEFAEGTSEGDMDSTLILDKAKQRLYGIIEEEDCSRTSCNSVYLNDSNYSSDSETDSNKLKSKAEMNKWTMSNNSQSVENELEKESSDMSGYDEIDEELAKELDSDILSPDESSINGNISNILPSSNSEALEQDQGDHNNEPIISNQYSDTLSSKRRHSSCESDKEAPAKKIRTHLQGYFDPIREHQAWCPYVTSRSKSGPNKNSADDNIQVGWQRVLQVLLLSSPQKKMKYTMRNTPPHQSLRNLRKIFNRWTSEQTTATET